MAVACLDRSSVGPYLDLRSYFDQPSDLIFEHAAFAFEPSWQDLLPKLVSIVVLVFFGQMVCDLKHLLGVLFPWLLV